jgi:hypothetical protein
MFLLRNPSVAELAETNMAIRLVPLAVAGGKPRKISKGNVSKEPPPAMVLTKPANKPAAIKTRISNGKSNIKQM